MRIAAARRRAVGGLRDGMVRLRRGMRSLHPHVAGLAVGSDTITVALARRRPGRDRIARLGTRSLDFDLRDGRWPGLERALGELIERSELPAGAVVHIALLPPLSHTKAVSLPPVSRAAAGELLRRNAPRFFVGGSKERMTDAIPVERRRRRSARRCLAGCAEGEVVRAVMAAVEEAGLRGGVVVPGTVAALRGARAVAPAALRGKRRVRIRDGQWREMVLLKGGRPAAVLPERADPPAGVEPDTSEAGEVLLDASAPDAAPAPLAALGAALEREDGLRLADEGTERARWRRVHVRRALLVAATLLFLGLCGRTILRGLDARLVRVAALRADLAPRVERVLATEEDARSLRALSDSIVSFTASRASRVETIGALALALPSTAYVRTLGIDGARVRIAGLARSAAGVVRPLSAHPLFHQVELRTVQEDPASGAEAFALVISLPRDSARGGTLRRPGR